MADSRRILSHWLFAIDGVLRSDVVPVIPVEVEVVEAIRPPDLLIVEGGAYEAALDPFQEVGCLGPDVPEPNCEGGRVNETKK